MADFSPLAGLFGGALIGLSAVLLMLFTGRIAGISGILGAALTPAAADRAWRFAFIAGLIAAPLITGRLGYPQPTPQMPSSWIVIVAAGLLVGFGSRMGGGCTSGHGICGVARFSARSIAATCIFVAMATATVAIMRHGMGG